MMRGKQPTLVISALCVLFFSCSENLSTQSLIDANFLASGQTAIDLLSPTQDQQVATANPTFSWSSRKVSTYTIQIASDAGFSNLVLSKDVAATSYDLVTTDLSGVSSLTTATYYWRVKIAKITNSLQSKTGSFFLVAIPASGSGSAGTMYVNGASTASVQNGSKQTPYKKIQDAISGANVLRNGNKNISINLNVAKGTYSELVNLAAGISIYGGYDSADWSRSISGNVTTISAPQTTAVTGDSGITAAYTTTTVVDGFTITGGTVAGSTINNYGIYLNGAPMISNNTISGGSGSVASQYTYGVFISGANPVITGNSINGGAISTTGNAYAIACTSCAATITYNSVHGGSSSSFTHAIWLSGGSPVIAVNSLFGGTGVIAYAMYMLSSSNPIISNNTINGGGGSTQSYAIAFYSSAPAITNNIIFTTSATTRICVYEGDAGADPVSFQNNLLFDCAFGLYADQVGVGGNCPSDTARNCYSTDAQLNTSANTTGGGVTTAQGNLGATSVANFAAVNFASASDLHLTASSPLNVRCGGKDASTATCGTGLASSCGGVLKDFDNLTRTAALTGTCVGASNTGAAGYSMGAYEKD